MQLMPLSPSSKFSVRSMYNMLHPSASPDILAVDIWRAKMPSKASFLLWLIYAGKILTQDIIMKKGVQLASHCSLCKKDVESVSHLFLHCDLAANLREEFLSRFRLPLAVPESIAGLLSVFLGSSMGFKSPKGAILWKCVPHIMCWM